MIIQGKRSGPAHIWAVTGHPGSLQFFEIFARDISWYMMASKEFLSRICFRKKKSEIEYHSTANLLLFGYQ